MLALSPPQFSNNIGFWPLEDAIGHVEDQNYFYKDINSSSPFRESADPPPSDHNQSWPAQADQIDCTGSNLNMAVKKLNHNASERDRRKKINNMYSSLRSLLPLSDYTKKLSIPATVSRVLKYIPEIQQQVEALVQKREEVLSRINSKQLQVGSFQLAKQEINYIQTKRAAASQLSTLFSVSASQLSDKEVSLQISTYNIHVGTKSLSEILKDLERHGVLVLNASSFESLKGRVFHNLHLQVEGSCGVECGKLGEKLKLSLCSNKELVL